MRRNRVLNLVALSLLALVLVVGGCVPKAGSAGSTAVPTAAAFPLRLTDQAGNIVSISKMPEKIVSLAPGNTEIVYALGLGDKLVADTEYCDYPEDAKSKPKIGGFSTIDIEKVVSFQPDLVLAADIDTKAITPRLVAAGLTVLTLAPKSLDEVMAAIEMVGRVTGTEDRAAKVVSEMRSRIKTVTDKTDALAASQRPGVLYVLWYDPVMTVGPNTIISEMITKAGGSNVAAGLDSDYPTMSLEAVVSANPAVIVADGGHGNATTLSFDFASAESRLASVAARQDNRVYQIDSDLVTIPGPRVVDGLEEMARLLHPDIFGQASR